MIAYVMVGTNDLDSAVKFYDRLMSKMSMVRVETDKGFAAYAPKSKPENIEFYVTKPFDGNRANSGNGTTLPLHTLLPCVLWLLLHVQNVFMRRPWSMPSSFSYDILMGRLAGFSVPELTCTPAKKLKYAYSDYSCNIFKNPSSHVHWASYFLS